MHDVDVLLGLLVAVAVLVTLARRLAVPYPILLVLGGVALGLVPGLPRVELRPELVFLLFLPPLLYREGLSASVRDLRADLRAITLLAVGLVLATTGAVALVAHATIGGLTWPAAFVLGAIVSPTDTVATAAIMERLGAHRRLVTVLQGESLVNDATAVVAYRTAVAAAVSGTFSLGAAGLRFVVVAAGGIALGLATGWAIAQLRRRLDDPPVENTISLLTPCAAYLPAEALGVSGVLAVVTTGLYLGRQGPRIVSSRTRLQANAMWEMIVFLLNGLIFILIGLELRAVVEGLSGHSAAGLVADVALVGLTVVLVRLIWVFPGAYLPGPFSRRIRGGEPSPPWQRVTVLG